MTHTLKHRGKLSILLAAIYIVTLSVFYTFGNINTINDINGFQRYLHENHISNEELRKEYFSFSSPEFSAAAKDPYFKSEDYRNIVKLHMDNEQSMLRDGQNILATYKRQTDRFVFAREAYKNLEASFPQDTVPIMDEEMYLRVFLMTARDEKCDPNDPYDQYDPNDPYFMIAKKYNFCSAK